MFYEPFWMFTTIEQEDRTTDVLEHVPVSLGAPGSGTYRLGREILAATGMAETRMDLRDLDAIDSGEALLRGEVKFIGMSLPWDAPIVQQLLRDPKVDALDWTRADAFVALSPFLSKVRLPRGVADLANDRPPHDVTLIATTASLVAREDLHSALQHLLLEAASKIHDGPSVFNKAGEFPKAESIGLPLSEVAHAYYRSGQPFLQRYLPFWLAAFTSRLLVLLIPIIGVGYPLFRLLPALFGWSMRHRVYRLYGELKFLEAAFDAARPDQQDALFEQLNHLEQRVNRMRVPSAYAHMLYTLKLHIGMVREHEQNPRQEQQLPGPLSEGHG
jgi:hypothetical protein